MTKEYRVCRLDDIPEDGMEQFDLDGKAVLVCRAGGNIHAVEGTCPHRGAQLGTGSLQGTAVICPWHDWAFDIETGCGLTNPMSNLAKYEVRVEDGQVVIVIPTD